MMGSARLQRLAELVMVLGIVALCQPWVEVLHRYGLTITIAGLLTFMFTGWFGPEGNVTAADEGRDNAVFDVSDHHDGTLGDQTRGPSASEVDGPVGVRS